MKNDLAPKILNGLLLLGDALNKKHLDAAQSKELADFIDSLLGKDKADINSVIKANADMLTHNEGVTPAAIEFISTLYDRTKRYDEIKGSFEEIQTRFSDCEKEKRNFFRQEDKITLRQVATLRGMKAALPLLEQLDKQIINANESLAKFHESAQASAAIFKFIASMTKVQHAVNEPHGRFFAPVQLSNEFVQLMRFVTPFEIGQVGKPKPNR